MAHTGVVGGVATGLVSVRPSAALKNSRLRAATRGGRLTAAISKPSMLHPALACRRPSRVQTSLSKTPTRVSVIARAATEEDIPRVAVEGDTVRIHYLCMEEDGTVLESSKDENVDGISFEIGAGDVVGNPFYQGFDAAVRGLAVGQRVQLEASGGEWKQDLVFSVPIEHEEMQRLAGRYKNQGGLKEGAVLELSNGGKALILKVTDESVMLDANNMLAGKKLVFDIELLQIDSFVAEQ